MPYVRVANGRERSDSLRVAVRLAFFAEMSASSGRRYFVMVQRGFPNDAIDVGWSKREIKQGPVLCRLGRMKFSQWARAVRKRSNQKREA